MTISSLPARYLGQHELAELVERLAGQPELWSDQVSYAGGRRHYASIHRDEYVNVWLICWSPGNDTGWHDHDVSSGAVRVVRGALMESNPRIGGAHVQSGHHRGRLDLLRARPYSPADRGGGAEHLPARLLAPAVAARPVHHR